MTIKKRLLAFFLFLVIIPTVFISWLFITAEYKNHKTGELEKLAEIANLKTGRIEWFFKERLTDLQMLAEYAIIKSSLPALINDAGQEQNPGYAQVKADLDSRLLAFKDAYQYKEILLADSAGRIVYSTNTETGKYDLGEYPGNYLMTAIEKGKQGIALSDPVPRTTTSGYKMAITEPLYGVSDQLIGVLILVLDLDIVYGSILNYGSLGETGETLIGKLSGNTVTYLNRLRHGSLSLARRTLVLGKERGIPMQNAVLGKSGSGLSVSYRGNEVLAAWRHIPLLDWGLVAQIDTDEAYSELTKLRDLMLLIMGIAIVITLLMGYSIAQSIYRPIQALASGIQVITAGDLEHRIQINSRDELGVLAKAFNEMVEKTKELLQSKESLMAELEASSRKEILLRDKALSSTNTGFTIFDLNGNVIYSNPAFLKLWGYEKFDKVAGQSIASFVNNPDDALATLTGIMEKGYWTGELVCKRKDGSTFIADILANMVKGDGDEPIAITASFMDITQRKQTEEKLKKYQDNLEELISERTHQLDKTRETLELYNEALDSSINGVIIANPEGKISYANSSFLEMFEYKSKNKVIGTLASKLFISKRVQEFSDVETLINKSKEDIEEFSVQRKDGSVFSVEVSSSAITDKEGNTKGRMTSFMDITERKQAEQDLKRSNKGLEQFAYVASHDLQEPLRMVSSYTQLLAKRYSDKLDQDAQEFIHFAVDGANRMQSLIQDLLAYSRVGSRGQSLESTDCNSALGQALVDLRTAINESNALVTNDELPVLLADKTQLSQLFQNLLSNSIKFQGDEAPRIHIKAEQKNGEYLFSVRDNGIGIDPEYHEKIFVIFQRLHKKDAYSGNGIGLSICEQIVKRHGGQIWLESASGQGSTFYFTLKTGGAES